MVAQAALYQQTGISGKKRGLVDSNILTTEPLRSDELRIAMLSYHTCPLATLGGKDTGGMNVYVRDLTRFLGRLGVHVDVFTRSQDEHVPHVLHDLGYGNRVVHIPAGPERPMPKIELIKFIPDFVDGIIRFTTAKDIRYDLIHSHYWMSGTAGLDLKSTWQLPLIHMFHTLGAMKNRVAQTNEQLEGDYRIKGEKRVLRDADLIIAATPAEVAQLQWLYQADISKVEIVPPGVDTSRFYPIPKDEAKEFIGVKPCDRMLLFVGRIEPLKGLDVLLQAIAIMREHGLYQETPFCLAVIGGNLDVEEEGNEAGDSNAMTDEMIRLQEMRSQLGLEDFVVFLGRKSQDTLPYYYSAAEAVIVPSHYESFGMVALEAMACGTPVVASQVGGLAFLIQDGVTGYHVPVGDPEALCDRITALLTDQDLRNKLGQQAAEFAWEYRWEIASARIYDLYRYQLQQVIV
jgi:D-inositol-3-phosphate glycosyltransferase